MPDNMHDSYEIELRLKSNWANILDRQSKQFEGFIQKTTTATGRLEKSITGMQTNLAKTYEGMFVGSQKKVQELVNFSNYALQNVSASTQRMFSRIETLQNQVGKAIDKNKIKLEKYTKAAADARKKAALSIPGGKLEKGFMATAKKAETDAAALDDKITALVKHSDSILTKALADHFNILADSIKRKSNAVNKSTKLLIDNSLSQFNRLKSQGGFKGAAADMSDRAGGIVQLERQAKQVYANLAQLREARKTAENVFRNQTILASQQTNEKLKTHHEGLAKTAKLTLQQIAKQQIETAKAARTFTKEIVEQKNILSRSGGLKDIQAGWKSQLKVSNVKALMEPIIKNIAESGQLAGRGFTKKFTASLKEGDRLQAGLDAFKNKIAEIKQQATLLSKAGLIEPNAILPKIKKVENALKTYEAQIKQTRQEYAKFTPKNMVAFRVSELGGLSKARNEIAALAKQLPRLSKITEQNFEDTSIHLSKMEGLLRKHAANRKVVRKKIEAIENAANQTEKAMLSVRDKNLRAAMQAYINKLRGHADKVSKVMSRSISFDENNLKVMQNRILSHVRQTVSRVNQLMSQGRKFGATSLFGNIEEEYKKISKLIDQVSRKKFFRTRSIEEAKKGVKSLKQSVLSYKATIEALEHELRQLQMMQRRGFRNEGIRRASAELKEQIANMKRYSVEVARMSRTASMKMEQVSKSATKNIFRTGWEAVRNFRWQVAAVIYLVQRAVWAVSNTIGKIFNEIASFRQSAMALAAQFSFKTVGTIKGNFDTLYKYSRQLLERLQLEAARTILTFEDMMMLTKTFAQAGIIPKTDEDVRRIATIGTAIKTLTEGMANAGVQMRQELYAVIVGRQRATDQLGMMFKVMGINIQEMVDEGKRGGATLIKVLSDALEPFSELNNRMEKEFNAVKNRLQVIGQIIQRIGGEAVLMRFTKLLDNLANSLYNIESGNLTDLGKTLAAGLNVALNTLMAFGRTIKTVFLVWWDYIKAIADMFGGIFEALTGIEISSGDVAGNFRTLKIISAGLQGIFTTIANQFRLIGMMIKTIATVIKTVVVMAFSILKLVTSIFIPWDKIGSVAKWIVSNLPGAFKKVFEWVGKIFDKVVGFIGGMLKFLGSGMAVTGAGKDFVESIEGSTADVLKLSKEWQETVDSIFNSYDPIKNSLKEIDDIQNNMNEGLKWNLKELLNLPVDFRKIMEEAGKLGTDLGKMKIKSKSGLEKIEEEARQRIAKYSMVEADIKLNLARFEKFWASEAAVGLSDKQLKALKGLEKGHKDVLNDILEYNKMVNATRDKESEKFLQKEMIRIARQKRTYDQFVREVSQTPMTPLEKVNDWYAEVLIKVRELKINNEEFKKHAKEIDEIIAKGFKLREDNAMKKMNLEAEKFINKASKANAWNNVFDELNTEFAEYVRQIEKSNDLDKEKKEELRKQLEIIKAQRAEQEKLNIAYESYLAQLDVQTKKASFLKGSYSPIKQRQGEIMELRVTYQKEMAQMGKSLDEFNKKWKEQGDWSKDATEDIKAQGKAMEESMKSLTAATERELKKKQFPIWNDLVEASNQWADGFTDALSEIINGVDSVTEALDALQKQILQDTLKIVIKRTITDNLQDMLGNEGVIGKMFGVKGKKEKVMEITAKKPLPVYITNSGGTVPGAEGAGKIGELGKGSSLGKPMPVFVTNQCCMGGVPGSTAAEGVQGVSQDLADISEEIAKNTDEAAESSRDWVDKMKDGFSDIGSSISDMVKSISSSGGGGSGGGGSWWSSLTSWFGSLGGGGGSSAGTSTIRGGQGGGYGFAEGGTITEPIIGKGLKSGEVYNFGEKTKYGENEIVAPMKKMQKVSGSSKIEYHMPIHLSAIDTQSGIQFLVKHSDVIQGQMVRNLKQNKPIRKGIQNAY